MMQRLIYWLFVRGKQCRHFCVICEYYEICKESVESEKERQQGREKF